MSKDAENLRQRSLSKLFKYRLSFLWLSFSVKGHLTLGNGHLVSSHSLLKLIPFPFQMCVCSKQYSRSSMLNVDMKKINTKKMNWNAKISKWHRRVDSLSANGVHRSVSTPVLNLKILQLCQFPFSSTYGLPLWEQGVCFPSDGPLTFFSLTLLSISKNPLSIYITD